MSEILFAHEYPRRLRAAVIGCGSHAMRNVFPTFQFAPVELVAACDLDESRALAVTRLFGGARVFTDYHRMLEEVSPDVVFVVLNYDEHGRPRYPMVAIDVLRSGAHAWIEKPPAGSSNEVLAMIEASRETGKFVGVGFKKMFAPANMKARQILDTAEFGELTAITARYPQPLPPQEDRDNDSKMTWFLDHVVHPYSVLRLLGGPVESLRFERESRTGSTLTTIRFTNGALGSLHLTNGRGANAPLERTEITGEGGMIVVDNNLRVTYYRSGKGPGAYGRTASFYGDDDSAPLFWEPEVSLGQLYNKGLFMLGYAPEVLSFCEDVLQSRPPEKGNLQDALELTRIYEAYRQPDGTLVRLG